jgi:hypothetical protein
MSPTRVGSEPGNEADKGLGFGLLSDPLGKTNGGRGLWRRDVRHNKVGGDRFPDGVEVIGGGGETFEECPEEGAVEDQNRVKDQTRSSGSRGR